jgi:hypothetical protein
MMTEPKKIDPETMREMLKAAEGMGVSGGQQDLRQSGVVDLNPVTAFSSHFGEWAVQGPHILVHLFPRAGAADVWYPSRYSDDGKRYVPGRREIKPKGLAFPGTMTEIIQAAADAVTFGDVELDYVGELGAWAIRFRDVEPQEDWLKEGGLLEQFFTKIDEGLDEK